MLKFAIDANEEFNINNLKNALIGYIIAKQKEDGFIIVVDDLDSENRETKDGESIDILKKFAIESKQTIYRSKNLKIYQEFAYRLLKDKKAYACFCADNSNCNNNCEKLTHNQLKSLKEKNQKFTIRISQKDKHSFLNTTKSLEKENSINLDFEILNAKGLPSATFTSAIDDMSMGITDSINKNSLKEKYIHYLLGYDSKINYYNLAQIDNNITIKSLLKQGFLPDAIINYTILLYNNTPKEIFYLPDAIEFFDISKAPRYNVTFDIDTLKKINQQHLLKMDSKKLSNIFKFSDSDIGELLKIFLRDSSTINELQDRLDKVFNVKTCSNKNKEVVENLSKIILEAPMIDSFSDFKKHLIKKSKLDNNTIEKYISFLLTADEKTKDIEEIYNLIKPYLLEVARCQ